MKSICLALIITALIPSSRAAENKTQCQIVATVLNKDGSPAAGVILDIFKLKGTQLQIDLDQGTVTNPHGKCDNNGKLTISVPAAYFRAGDRFTIGDLGKYSLRDDNGNLVTFVFPETLTTKTINLGKVTLK